MSIVVPLALMISTSKGYEDYMIDMKFGWCHQVWDFNACIEKRQQLDVQHRFCSLDEISLLWTIEVSKSGVWTERWKLHIWTVLGHWAFELAFFLAVSDIAWACLALLELQNKCQLLQNWKEMGNGFILGLCRTLRALGTCRTTTHINYCQH